MLRPLTLPPAPAVLPTQNLRGDLAVWIFILAELLAFGVFFLAYAFARARQPAVFDAAQALLDRHAGALNTVLLVTSSALVAHAVVLVRAGAKHAARRAGRALLGAIACGLGFVLVKGSEYAVHFAAGMELSSSTFSMFYLGLTGFHFFHVLLGLAVLTVLWRQTAAGAYSPRDANGLESGAVYWHMVDLVWLVLFPLVYVMR
ncbi:MAG TPA: cytochrome c oxidase subunit 3 family protein [Rhodocyclaceae bacterium]|nr:cytochrome c oxidase subunit 3 family protein [Rhodocyclaceae bacterium]